MKNSPSEYNSSRDTVNAFSAGNMFFKTPFFFLKYE